MAIRRDPAAQRWLFGRELARLRERTGRTLADIANSAGLTRAKVGHWETGKHAPSSTDLQRVLDVLKVTEAERGLLESLLLNAQGQPWWAEWSAVVTDWLALYLGLEGMAQSVFAYEPVLVPGMLQTAAYANELTSQALLVRSDDVEPFVELRMARAARLTQEPLLDYHVVIEEAAFHRRAQRSSTMIEQCDHLLELSQQTNIHLQVLRSDRRLHPATSMGQYAILDFAGSFGVAYRELYDEAVFIHDETKIRSYKLAASHTAAEALTAEETREFIARLRKDLK
ncbi:helix-turn-helix protein [Stackebrandtia albiflava]|uniref:Helix-turn-helix protein n=1 Tax=Stackebrandtia albiflava TaxID=406432 RepID=A0A562UL95_9ACTN|nr:helix-turn-helix transcriptional regulator [Stackebrandtia albiflava]TWJ06376.1 helix-turn-helix protein [Stackebrandtia albiflava]